MWHSLARVIPIGDACLIDLFSSHFRTCGSSFSSKKLRKAMHPLPLLLAHFSPLAPNGHHHCFHLPTMHHRITLNRTMRRPLLGVRRAQPIPSLPSRHCHLYLVEAVAPMVGKLQTRGLSVAHSGCPVSPGQTPLPHLVHPRDSVKDGVVFGFLAWT
jgi:hypothetical protein